MSIAGKVGRGVREGGEGEVRKGGGWVTCRVSGVTLVDGASFTTCSCCAACSNCGRPQAAVSDATASVALWHPAACRRHAEPLLRLTQKPVAAELHKSSRSQKLTITSVYSNIVSFVNWFRTSV